MRLDQKQLNQTTWQCVKLYSKASKAGSKIEEIILFNYILRLKLLLIIEKRCIKVKKPFKSKWFHHETNQLASTSFQLGGIDEELLEELKNFYESVRSYLVHNLITQPMDYDVFKAYDENKGGLLKRLQSALGIELSVKKELS